MNTAVTNDLITLPELAVQLGVSLDLVRREFRRRPELAALARRAGNCRFVEAKDLGRVKGLLTAK